MSHSKKSRQTETVVEAARAGVQDIAQAGTDVYNAAIEQSQQTGRNVDQYVRSNPWYAIGIAAGVGLLVGALLRRR